MCILAVFAPVSAKCTYENSFFLKIIRAQSLPEAFFDENARIKTAFFRFSYVHSMQTNERHYSFSDRRRVEDVRDKLNRLKMA